MKIVKNSSNIILKKMEKQSHFLNYFQQFFEFSIMIFNLIQIHQMTCFKWLTYSRVQKST